MRSRFKSWAKPFLDAHPEFVLEALSSDPSFFSKDKLCLEIGSGKGAFLLNMAKKFPETNFLGLERDISICGVFAKTIAESELQNIRLMPMDFDDAFLVLKDLRFNSVFLNFSDPWPKKKHAKRRLTTAKRLEEMASLLKEDGLLKIKTDNDILYEFTLEEGAKAGLELLSSAFDYAEVEENDALTEYESSFRLEGKPIHRLIYKKKER